VKNFQARAECIEKQFSAFVVTGDLHENGKLVLGEKHRRSGRIEHRALGLRGARWRAALQPGGRRQRK